MKDFLSELRTFAGQLAVVIAILIMILAVAYFPYDIDRPLSPAEISKARTFYTAVYDQKKSVSLSPDDVKYARMALAAAERNHVKEQVAEIVRVFDLREKKVLEIGSGQGYLQDMVADYTGLDISPAVARYYRKPFVLGSATSMPFADDTFDSAWSIWVFEHVPNPEAALSEARRVVKDGGILFLAPQWDVHSWQADGYDVRPYSDFGLLGRVTKATIPVRSVLERFAMPATRLARAADWHLADQPMRFHYHRLRPNFQIYWEPDSDAVNSLDFYEMALWFRSRGDECLTCEQRWNWLTQTRSSLVIRIHKKR